jgi:ATP-dependent DNA helicase 2 subunit 2
MFSVPPKTKSTRGRREQIKPLSGLDVDSLLDRKSLPKGPKIDPQNAVPEFKRMLRSATNYDESGHAMKEMAMVIRSQITKSLGDREYEQQIENMRVFREELIIFEYPEQYNTFVRDLKTRLSNGELGGDRREFWFEVRKNKLGLIDNWSADGTNVAEEDAKLVCIAHAPFHMAPWLTYDSSTL